MGPVTSKLSVRLPFSKDVWGEDGDWMAQLRRMPKRTLESEAWFINASKLDKARRTQLGTLNYLPPEIRSQIWSCVFNLDERRFRPTYWSFEIHLYSIRRYFHSLRNKQGTLSSLRLALCWSGVEIDHFSTTLLPTISIAHIC